MDFVDQLAFPFYEYKGAQARMDMAGPVRVCALHCKHVVVFYLERLFVLLGGVVHNRKEWGQGWVFISRPIV